MSGITKRHLRLLDGPKLRAVEDFPTEQFRKHLREITGRETKEDRADDYVGRLFTRTHIDSALKRISDEAESLREKAKEIGSPDTAALIETMRVAALDAEDSL